MSAALPLESVSTASVLPSPLATERSNTHAADSLSLLPLLLDPPRGMATVRCRSEMAATAATAAQFEPERQDEKT